MKLATSSQMQALDRTTINEIGIPGIVLMENAGQGTVQQMESDFGQVRDKTVCIFVGPGNNGGDGLVIGRHVLQRGGFPFLIFLVPQEKLGGDAGINAVICKNIHLPGMLIQQEEDIDQLEKRLIQLHFAHPVHCLVDALFGTGLSRNLKGRFATIIQFINRTSRTRYWPVVAVDIPSGLSSDTGEVFGCCVKADLTVTFGLAKPGHYLHGGPDIGKLAVIDISIPDQVVKNADLPGQVIDQTIGRMLLPRPQTIHKGTVGHLLILAGSIGKTGAAILSGRAALHSGCGLVTLAVPAELNPIFETSLPEAMTVPLPLSKNSLSIDDYDRILELLAGKGGLVLGPGLGAAHETAELVRQLYRDVALPIVVDADALNLLALEPKNFIKTGGDRILTPHPGEMSGMTGLPVADIQKNRIQTAHWLNDTTIKDDHEIITVLKGAGTVICSSSGRWAVNSSGNPGMATGGMGDVLSGLIGGLLVQGYSLMKSSEIGIYMHGLAADLLAEHSSRGFTAGEVAKMLPLAAQAMITSGTNKKYLKNEENIC